MSNNQDSEDDGANGGDKPSCDHHEIVVAVKSLEGKYSSAQDDRAKHDRKTLCWAKVAGFGVWVYTLLTAAIMAAAIHSAITSHDQEERSLRAYVGVSNEEIVLNCAVCDNPNKPHNSDAYSDENMITFQVQNYGQTPAYDGVGVVGVKDMPPGHELPSNFNYPLAGPDQRTPAKAYPWVIEPHETNHFGMFIDGTTADLIKKVRAKQIWLYFYGEMTYIDVFGCEAKLLFCFRYIPDNDPNHRFPFCPEHNEPAKKCERPQTKDWSLFK